MKATVELGNGYPSFVTEGERIRVDTRTGEYSERVKE